MYRKGYESTVEVSLPGFFANLFDEETMAAV
jgi:hypothetical protein